MWLYVTMVVPSTCVTGHPDTTPNSVLWVTANRKMSGLHMWRRFGGRIPTFHAGAWVWFPDDVDYIFLVKPLIW